jgi:hypothetical protein
MTTLQSWISYSDTGESPHLPRAIYIASDSRITWGTENHRWEAGRKVFVTRDEPHLFGFCGDVILPALVIGQVLSAIDSGVLFAKNASTADRHDAVFKAIQRSIEQAISTPTSDFTIHHIQREHEWPQTSFRAWSIFFNAKNRSSTSREIPIPETTNLVGTYGSGKETVAEHHGKWKLSDAAGRSRAFLASLCDSIRPGNDPLSGGPPQVAALYTNGPPIQIGMIVDGRRYLNGLEVDIAPQLSNIEWRDSLGQVVDPMTGKPMLGARRFARPAKL